MQRWSCDIRDAKFWCKDDVTLTTSERTFVVHCSDEQDDRARARRYSTPKFAIRNDINVFGFKGKVESNILVSDFLKKELKINITNKYYIH